MSGQPFFSRSRRFSSVSTASRRKSVLPSSVRKTATRRASEPFGKGARILSGQSILRPTRRGVATSSDPVNIFAYALLTSETHMSYISHMAYGDKSMRMFPSDQALFQAYGKRCGEPAGCTLLGRAKATYVPHIYRGGCVIPGWGYSVERIERGFVAVERAGRADHVG